MSNYKQIAKIDNELVYVNQSIKSPNRNYINIGFNGISFVGGKGLTELEVKGILDAIELTKIYTLFTHNEKLYESFINQFSDTVMNIRKEIKKVKVFTENEQSAYYFGEFTKIFFTIKLGINRCDYTDEVQSNSKYKVLSDNSRKWYFMDNSNNVGFVMAVTEMEAIDRVRDSFKEVLTIKWIGEKIYNDIFSGLAEFVNK